MAWSDAARKAAAEARRLHAKKKPTALQNLDAQLAHWGATKKQHDAQLKVKEWNKKNNPAQIAEDRRTDKWFKHYMKYKNRT